MKYTIVYLGFGCGGYIIGYNMDKYGKIKNYINNKKGKVKIFNTKKLAKEYIKNKLNKKEK